MESSIQAVDRMKDSYSERSEADLLRDIAKQKFFHDMELRSGVRTGSWVYGSVYPANYHLWPVLDFLSKMNVSGKTCLDIGTYDGMTAFAMASMGASRVDATCQYDLERFRLVRAYQDYSNIAYYPHTDLNQISSSFPKSEYDAVVMSAMLHHLTSPFDALLEARRLLKPNGLFLLESIVLEGEHAALMLNTELSDPVYGSPTLFLPTPQAVRGMLRLAGFDIVSETMLVGGRVARETNYDRMTFLARACRPSENVGRTAKAKEIQETSKLGALDFNALEEEITLGSTIDYVGPAKQSINVWIDQIESPLQPSAKIYDAKFETKFEVGREKPFLELAAKSPNDAFSWDDVYLLGARYSGETMPEGMSWSIKQLGNLHVLDFVRKYGLSNVLEVGPGFNLYFPRHLPTWCSYTGLDSLGFYDPNVLGLANSSRPRGIMVDGLLGDGKHSLGAEVFDACVSVSVLEHVPAGDIRRVCEDMFRVLKPGGWALHSIDLPADNLGVLSAPWLKCLLDAGFSIDVARTDASLGGLQELADGDSHFLEPLSIRSRFYHGYKKTIWGNPLTASMSNIHVATILVSARKPN